ncbi:hypothetical protein RGUI_1215 [Rhodovulum sp. P5]|nr:hypothetical protein RGUI_1215 [Rhodovulum sp. P5]
MWGNGAEILTGDGDAHGVVLGFWRFGSGRSDEMTPRYITSRSACR